MADPISHKDSDLCLKYANDIFPGTIIHHYDFPVYMHDELQNTSKIADSLVEDGKVSKAYRDAQLAYLTFLPVLKSIRSYDRTSLEKFAIQFEHIVACLRESGRTNCRIPKGFEHKQVG